jgi:hypothetical protein
MANQITVNSGTGNITVTTSRAVIGTVANVASANYANFAGEAFDVSGSNVTGTVANATFATTAGSATTASSATTAGTVTTAAQPNITSVGNLTNLTVTNTTTTGNLVVLGNLQVGNLVANSANYANFAGNAFAVAGANVTGTVANATFATTAGSANTANSATVANSANAVAGANVSGTVANATFATSAGTANTANSATVANSANSVTLANVSGAGNIAGINLDGNVSNILTGNGTFVAIPTVSANANYANFAGNAFSVDGGNVVGAVANATFALDAGNANIANIAYSVSGANVSGAVANATFALDAGNANIANIAYSVDGANVTGTVANATFALDAGNANIANIAYSVAAANVSGLGNIATINLDGNVSNLLTGNGTFVAIPTSVANANYANFAGQAIDATQSNITQTGNLVSLTVDANIANSTTVQVNGNLISYAGANYYSVTNAYNAGAGIGDRGSQAIVLVDANDSDFSRNDYYINKGGNAKMAFSEVLIDNSTIGNGGTDPLVPGSVGWSAYHSGSNLANPSTATAFNFNIGGGALNIQSGAPVNGPAVSLILYGNTAGGSGQQGIRFRRRGGNADTRTNVAANYYLGNIEWQGASTATGGFNANATTARVSAKVESTYANTGPIPTALEFQVSNGTTSTHNFHANGSVAFQRTVSTGNGNITLNSTGTIDYLRTFGSFTSNATQTSNGANTTNYMTLNNTEDANGISIASSTQITVARTGRYNIQFSAQVEKTDGGTDIIEIWLDKNGTAVANTATQLELQGSGAKAVAAWDFNVNAANVNDYFRLAWASPDTAVQLTAIDTANTISGVAIPSVILDINPIGA